MPGYAKPIQPTPTLSGEDAKKIVKQVLTKPSDASVKMHEELLALRRKEQKK